MLRKTSSALAVFVFLLACLVQAAQARDVAIVVHKSNPVENMSANELYKVLSAEMQFWNNDQVHILMREEGSWERAIILKKVYKMSEEELKKMWLSKIFQGEVTSFPSTIGVSAMAKQIIDGLPGAVTFMDSNDVDDTVKVVKIDGKLPGQDGYALKEE